MTVTHSLIDHLSNHLNRSTTKHVVAGRNIANVNTPGFKAKEVSFTEALADSSKITVSTKSDNAVRLDGNSVDIDQELGALKKNATLHNAYTQMLAMQIRQMRSAMNG